MNRGVANPHNVSAFNLTQFGYAAPTALFMAYERPTFHVHEHNPVFGTPPILPREYYEHDSEARREAARVASREAGQREAAYLQALSGVPTRRQPPRQLRQPTLPDDFADAMDRFDDEIFTRGIAVSRDRLLSLGRTRFSELLALDRAAREEQRVVGPSTDLSSWFSVHQAFSNANALATGIRPRKTSEIWVGAGEDRERAGQFSGFADLWKSVTEPRAVRAIYSFRNKFESLVLAMSMLDRISSDGKIHSRFFCSGKPAGRFADWLNVIEQPHAAVTLLDSTGDIVCWMANERTPPPRPLEFAQYLSGLRAPSVDQIKVARAIWRAFALGYVAPWDIWNFVGSETRVRTETATLEVWRKDLAARYPRIEHFHSELRDHFYRPVEGQQFEFNARAHRQFIDANVQKLRNRLSAVTAMAVEDVLPSSVVARFADSILVEMVDHAKHTAKLDACISRKLQAAFPNSEVQFRITA
jgi:hypothetical protein